MDGSKVERFRVSIRFPESPNDNLDEFSNGLVVFKLWVLLNHSTYAGGCLVWRQLTHLTLPFENLLIPVFDGGIA
ncbi:hypothetical protein FM104_13520 [Microbacterium esteraromaticum]|uniref:Uncharacterized protein n=1 Tax=Microbacterium esteraromaticum TaxID=57043 RepID=A0A1R4KKI5_9MICO|nr:hypothetical protein FM104_13520 [Microbacterium esteraromaticum]